MDAGLQTCHVTCDHWLCGSSHCNKPSSTWPDTGAGGLSVARPKHSKKLSVRFSDTKRLQPQLQKLYDSQSKVQTLLPCLAT